jgi:hypothetical protein
LDDPDGRPDLGRAAGRLLAGIAVLVASGLYIWRREVALGLRR